MNCNARPAAFRLILFAITVLCSLIVVSASASKVKVRRLTPIWLHKSHTPTTMGRSNAETGRGLLQKFFKNFQEPQNNIIIITQNASPTGTATPPAGTPPATTSPTFTVTTSARAQDGEEANLNKESIVSATQQPNTVPVLLGVNGIDAKLAVNRAKGSNTNRKRHRKRRLSMQNAGIATKPHMRGVRKGNKRNGNHNRKKILNKNKNNNNKVHINNIDSDGNVQNAFTKISTNSRIADIFNAFRRQTPVVRGRKK